MDNNKFHNRNELRKIFAVVDGRIHFQLFGIACGTFFTILTWRFIVIFFPLATIFGIILAWICFRKRLPLGMSLGLTSPLVSITCLTLLYPEKYDMVALPLKAMLISSGTFQIVLGAFAIRECQHAYGAVKTAKFQFRISTLLVLMTLVTVMIALFMTRNVFAISVGVLMGYGFLFVFLQHQFRYKPDREKITPSEDISEQ